MGITLPMTHPSTGVTIVASQVAIFGNAASPATPIDIRDGVPVLEGATGNAGGIVANAGSGGVNFAANADSGDVWSIGNVTLNSGAVINGNLRTHGTVTPNPPLTQVTGTSSLGTTINLGLTVIRATFPPRPLQDFNQSTDLTLASGSYGDVTLNGGTLTLSPGTYTFESLTLNSGTTFAPNTTNPVFINVRNALIFRGHIGTYNANNVRFAAFSSLGATLEQDAGSPLLGTVVAINGPLILQGSRSCQGALFGQTSSVQPGATLRHIAFSAWESPQ